MAPTPQPTMTREQQQALARARARARISTGAGLSATNPMVAQGQAAQREYAAAGSPELPADNSVRAPTDPLAKRSIEPIKPSPWSVSQSSYDEMAASPQRSVVGEAPQWATEAPLMGGRTIQDEGREALQSAGTKFRVNTSGTQLDNRHNADGPDLVGGIGDLLKAGNFAVRDWWKNSSYKDKENLIASIPIEATGAGAIARLSDHIGQKTGNDFLKDKTGNFATDANYDPVAELEMYLINAGTWSTRNAAGGAINPRAQAAKIGPQLPGMRQALAKPALSEFATPAADVATNLTMGLSDVTAAGVRGALGLAKDLRPKPRAEVPPVGGPNPGAGTQTGTPPPQPQPGPAPQSAPVAQAPIPQAAPRAAQAGPSGAGQGTAAAQPVLNATPVAAGQNPVAMAKSDARIIGRLLKAGGVARNDVNNLLAGLVQAYQGSNSSRLPLAFFAEEYLPTVLPKQTADDVIQKLRGFGRERYSANGPKDTSRSTMRNTVDTLRSTQQDNLSGVMDANLYKGKLIGQEDKLNAQLEQNARTAYTTALENANNRLLNGKATQAERDALGEIQALLHNGAFLKEVPAHLRIKAMRDGINLEDYVQKDPIAAAHWLQSELRQAVTAAEGVGGMATSESRLYGEMRTTLLEQLEKVVPGYRGARKAHGDIYGAKEAIEFGGNFFKSARSEVETARLARQFKAMSVRQKTAATMSIRDALKNEFRNKAEDTAAKVTRLQQAGVLDALETVLGADGKRVAEAIRNTVKENERLRAVDQLSGSPTHDNTVTAEAAQKAVRSPLNTAIKNTADKSNLLYTAGIDAMLMGGGLPPFATAGALVGRAADKFGNPGAKQLSSVTKTLYDLPAQPNALSGPPKPPKVSGPRAPKPPPEQIQATLDDLLNQYSALDHRANPAAGQKLLRQIERLKKQLPTPNALSTPPGPPVKGGPSGTKLNGMGGTPEGVGAAGGATVGYFANPTDANGDGVIDDADRGLNAMGGLVSGALGVKAARMGVGAVKSGANALRDIGKAPELPPLTLPKESRVFSPGKPDDLGFITSAEYVLGNPPARFRDAKALTADQWRKFMREGGASAESFKWQIEPALKRLADEGVTGDIPKAKLEEALARTRGTLSKPPSTRTVSRSSGSTTGRPGSTFEVSNENDYHTYVAAGPHDGYKTHVLLLPETQGKGYKSHNWQVDNPVGHVRTTNRTSTKGEKVLHVEELQSDLHQEGAKYGYRDAGHVASNNKLELAQADYTAKSERFQAWLNKQPAKARNQLEDIGDADEIVDPTGRELFREMQKAADRVTEVGVSHIPRNHQPPRAPLENWEEPFIRYALKQGSDQGVDVVTFPKWDTLHDALRNEGTQKFYDARLPRHLESVAKSLGLKVEAVELPISVGFAGNFRGSQRGSKFAVANDKLGEWYFSAGEFDTLREAQQAAAQLNKKTQTVPAIRLTPEAKQRLSEGIIMDAKDPGRRAATSSSAPPKPTQAGFGGSGGKGGGAKPPANALAGPPKPKPVEARREAPRGTKSFSDPRLSPGENKTAEMVLNGYTYDEIADEAMTSVDVIKRQAMLAQRKLGDDVKLPRPGMGKRPPGSTKRDAANSLFGEGLDNATIAQRTGLSIGNVRTYRSYWKEQSNAPVASVEGAAYNPPAMPARPFEADYPQKDWPDGPPVDAQGRLTRDMDRKPLDQNSVIIGRAKAPGNGPGSEADRSLRDRIAIIQTLKKAGSSLELVPRPASQASGGWRPNFDAKGRFTGRSETQIANDLDRPVMGLDDQEVITLSHELAHSIDFRAKPARDVGAFNDRAWGIDHRNPDKMPPESTAKVQGQLERIYQDLNNPVDGEIKIRSPKDQGYDSVDADRELWAEAIRAYMYDPNYIKTVAPDVAFLIRHHVNGNSSLRKTIQFNAVPTIAAMGGLGLGAAALNGQPAEAQTRPGGLRANALASQYGERPGR